MSNTLGLKAIESMGSHLPIIVTIVVAFVILGSIIYFNMLPLINTEKENGNQ